MSGFLIISRDFWDDPDFAEAEMSPREAFLWLLKEASWKPRTRRVNNRNIELDRAQVASSVRFMAEAWGWSKSRVHRYLQKLEERETVVIENRDTSRGKSGTGCLVITVCNYDKYQALPKDSGTAAGHQAGQQRDSSGTNENKGEIKGEEEGAISRPAPQPQPVDDAVEDWNALAEELGLTRCMKLTAARRSAISARLKDAGGLEGWRHALRRIRGSPFCRGNNDRGWKADIDWLATERGFTRLIEGKYDDDGRTGQQRGGSIALLERRRAQRAANGG